jgi:hypothetical protein
MLFVPPPLMKGVTSAFPVVQATVTDNKVYNPTNTANLPAGIVANDLILFIGRKSAAPTLTFPAGWNQILSANDGNNVITALIFFKIAAGGETNVSITASASTAMQSIAYRISGYVGIPEVASAASTTGNFDPPNLAPSWGSKKTFWLIPYVSALAAINPTPPANYTNIISTTNVQMNSAQRNLQAASEDPAAWGVNGGQGWRASTVAIQGT